jgi:hypothetical protein
VDVVVTALGAPAELWHNETVAPGHWLDVRLVGRRATATASGPW